MCWREKHSPLRARVLLQKAPGSEEIIIPSYFFFCFCNVFFFKENQGIFLSISISKQHRPQMRFQSYQGRLVKGGLQQLESSQPSGKCVGYHVNWLFFFFFAVVAASELMRQVSWTVSLLHSSPRYSILVFGRRNNESISSDVTQSEFVSFAMQTFVHQGFLSPHTHTHTHTLMGTHTAPSLGSSALWISALSLCVFNYAPSDRPLLRICRFLSPRL